MTEQNKPERLLPKFSINRPVTVTMVLIALLVIGFIGYSRIKYDLFPSGMNNPYLSVWIPYRDASPKEIEEQIVRPIEAQLKTVKNLKRLYSNSSSNSCWFSMEFAQGTNMDLAYSQVADRLERARPDVPDEIEHFYIHRQREDDIPILYMGISYSEDITDPYYVTEKHIKMAVEGVEGVANVELFGLRERYIQIIVDHDKVKTFKVNLSTVIRNLLSDNFAVSSGYSYIGKKKYLVRVSSRFSNLQNIRDIELKKGVRLSDIAKVVYDFDEEQRSIMRVDGKIAAGMVLYKESAANTVEVCERVAEKLKQQLKERPELKGVDYFIFWDQGRAISDSIDNVKKTAFWGGIFAFLVLFWFLRSMRVTIMLTLAIPLSLLATVLIMYFMGWTLNTITMMGLMLSIGLVVDNSIVITENIYRFNSMGYKLRDSAVWGASEVGLAITLATLTTVVVFLPMMLIGGDSNMSFIITRLGAPVIFALVASLMIALVFIPLASTRFLKGNGKTKKMNKATHSVFVQIYQTLLVKVLKHRLDSMILIIILIFSMFIPFNFMNKSDEGGGGFRDARVIVDFPNNYSIERRDRTMKRITDELLKRNHIYHIEHYSTRVSSRRGRIEIYLEPDRDKQWYQVIFRKAKELVGIDTYKKLSREELTEDIKKHLPVIPGVKMRTSWQDQSGGDKSSISFTLRGYEVSVLTDIAENIEKQIKLLDGVVSVENATEAGNDEIHLSVDREKAFKLGTQSQYIAQYVAFNLRRRKISNYQSDEKEIPIYVKFRQDQRKSVAQLRNTLIRTEGEAETNLASLSKMTFHKGMGNIRRENGKSFLEIKTYISDKDVKKMSAKIETILKKYKYPTGYYYQQGRRSRRMEEQNSDLQYAIILSLVLVFLIMGILFESFVLPLSVLVAIPAAFVGSFWLLLITGTTFDVMAGIGLVILVGVVVNNAIVLIDLINQYRNEGYNREQAIIVAGMHRFRPILMTALTTIFGLVPMAIGNASLIGTPYAPMGITMIGGLVSSTFLTLFAVPILYTYFDDFGKFLPKVLRRIF